jgi:hypothetical protein
MRSFGTIVALLLAATTSAAAEVKLEHQMTHSGMCEASGAVALPQSSFGRSFVVANDEDNVLRIFAADRSGAGREVDLNPFFGLNPHDEDDKADLEGATWLGDRIYWIGSHSRSGKGKLRPQRAQFFATTVRGEGDLFDIIPIGSHPVQTLHVSFAALDPLLAAAIRLDQPEQASLAPEEHGFNIEGMSAGADGNSILIGLRNPLSSAGQALVVTLTNPRALLDAAEKPAFGPLLKLDLGGRGIRSMEYSEAARSFYIIAGPTGGSGGFELYRWSVTDDAKPMPIPGFSELVAKLDHFQPEAFFIDPTGRKLHLLSDDGDRPMPTGKPCNKLKDPATRAFRSAVITLD